VIVTLRVLCRSAEPTGTRPAAVCDVTEPAVTSSVTCLQQQLLPVSAHFQDSLPTGMDSRPNVALDTVYRKNDTAVKRDNFDVRQLILIVFGRHVARRVCCQLVV